MMGNYYLLNRRLNWAAVCVSKNACTSLKQRVLLDVGINLAGKDAIHNKIGYSPRSPFLHPVADGRPSGCYCFAVWRDPVERFESIIRHFAIDGVRQGRFAGLPRHEPEAWVTFAEHHLALPPLDQDEHFRRQTDYFQRTDVDEIVEIAGLEAWFASRGWGALPHSNQSRNTFSLPEPLAARIRRLYAADYSLRPAAAGVVGITPITPTRLEPSAAPRGSSPQYSNMRPPSQKWLVVHSTPDFSLGGSPAVQRQTLEGLSPLQFPGFDTPWLRRIARHNTRDSALMLLLYVSLRQAERESSDALMFLYGPAFSAVSAGALAPPETSTFPDWEFLLIGATPPDLNTCPILPPIPFHLEGICIHRSQFRAVRNRLRRLTFMPWAQMITTAVEAGRTYSANPAPAVGPATAGFLTIRSSNSPVTVAAWDMSRTDQTASNGIHPAFLFLTRGDHNQPEIWTEFLGSGQRCSIYSHPKDPQLITSSLLAGTAIAERVDTAWGKVSLVRATLALLRAAFQSPLNSHFVLVSEACIPIKPLASLVHRLRSQPQSMISWETRDEVAQKYPSKAARLNRVGCLLGKQGYFQSQWMILDRTATALLLEEDLTRYFANVFAPDECYFATILALKGYPMQEARRKATFFIFQKGQGHPETYREVDQQLAKTLESSDCFFARKFAPDSNIRSWKLHLR